MNDIPEEDELGSSQENGNQKEDSRLAALFENTPDPIMKVEYHGEDPIIKKVNSAFEEAFGFDSDKMVGQNVKDVVVPEERIGGHESIRKQVLDGESVEMNVRRKTSTGLRDFKLRVIPFKTDKTPRGAYAWYTDITKRRKYEERLKYLNEASRKLMNADTSEEIADVILDVIESSLDHSLAGVWSYDEEESILNPITVSSEFKGHTSDHESDLKIEEGEIEMEVFQREEVHLVEDYEQVEESALSDVLQSNLCVPIDEEMMINVGVRESDSIDSSTRDLVLILARHARVAFEQNRREKELSRHSKAMDSAFDGIAILDDNGEYVYVNQAHAEVYGYEKPEEMIGKNWRELYEDDVAEELENEILPSTEDEPWRGELVGKKTDGTTFPQELTLSKFGDGGLICIVRDITESKEKEKKLHEQNIRLKEFGTLVSHDLRNPLTLAKGYVDIVKETGNDQYLEKIEGALERMETIINNLMLVSREEGKLETEEDELENFFIKAFEFANDGSAEYRIEGDLSFTVEGTAITGLFENLISNSVEHNEEPVEIKVGPLENGFYYEDTGKGIPEKEREKVFDYGYTTSGEGGGLGLAIVKRISTLNDWSIKTVESEDGGARFEIYFEDGK